MKRDQLEHVLRAVSRIVPDGEILVIGSQSVLGSLREEQLPPVATASMEVDIAFMDDPMRSTPIWSTAPLGNCQHSTRPSAITPKA